jgi:hypothetical protein
VYICSFVAYGIAKKTEDYLEALYRWAAGPLELMWKSFFRKFMLWHYFVVFVPFVIIALASFVESPIWYYIYIAMVLIFIIWVRPPPLFSPANFDYYTIAGHHR